MKLSCPKCGQPLWTRRYGAEMSSLKANIIDLIRQGGDEGMPVETVWRMLFRGRHASRETMKAHVWQINEMLAAEGRRIIVDRTGPPSYRVVRLNPRRRSA